MDDDKGVGISEAKKEQNSKSTKNEAGRKPPGIVISKLDSWSVHRICSGQVNKERLLFCIILSRTLLIKISLINLRVRHESFCCRA